MATNKFKATAELFLDTSEAKSDAKKFIADLKQQLSSIETAADKMTVFKDLVGYIAMIDKNLSSLIANNKDKFKHMFDGLDDNSRSAFEDLFGMSGDNLKKLDAVREKLSTLTPKSSIKEVRQFAKDLSSLYEAIGQTPDFNMDDFTGRVNANLIKTVTDAFNKFESLWVDKISGIGDNFSIGGVGGNGNLSESAQNEIKKLQDQISELKALKKELDSILQASKDSEKGNAINLEVDLSNVEKLIKKYKELDSVSENLQKGTREYYDNLAQRAKVGLQLFKVGDDEGLDKALLQGVEEIIYSDSFANVLSNFERNFKNISAIYDQAIVEKQQKIQNIKNKVLDGVDRGADTTELHDSGAAQKIDAESDAYNKLNAYVKEYINLQKQLSSLERGSDEYNDVLNRQREIQNKILQIKKINEDQKNSMYDFFEEIDGGAILKLEDVVSKLSNILQIDIPQGVNMSAESFERIGEYAVSATEYIRGMTVAIGEMFNVLSQPSDIEYDVRIAGQNISVKKGGYKEVSGKTSAENYLSNIMQDIDVDAHSHMGIDSGINAPDFLQAIKRQYAGLTKMSAVIGREDIVTLDLAKVKAEDAYTALNKLREVTNGKGKESVSVEDFNKILNDINPKYVDVATRWTPSQFGDLAEKIFNVKQNMQQAIDPAEKLKGLLVAMSGKNIDFSKYDDLLKTLSSDNAVDIFNQIAKAENIKEDGDFLQVGDISTSSIQDVITDIQRQKDEYADLRRTAGITYDEIASAAKEYSQIFNRHEGQDFEFFKKYFHPSEISEIHQKFMDFGDGLRDLDGLTRELAMDFGIDFDDMPVTALQRIGDTAQEVSNQLKAFFDLVDEIRNKSFDAAGNADDNLEIGKYTERLKSAKAILDEFGKQNQLTAEQMNQVNDAFNAANTHLTNSTVHYNGYGDGSYDYSYFEEYRNATTENDELRRRNTELENQLNNVRNDTGNFTTDNDIQTETAQLDNLLKKINEVKTAVDAKTNAFREEAGVVDLSIKQEVTSLENLKTYLESLQNIVQNLFNVPTKKFGLHYGNLDYYARTGQKSETFSDQRTSLSYGNWGSFGTGIYYATNPNDFASISTNGQSDQQRNKKFYAIDLSKYNLYMAQTNEQAEGLYNFLNKLQKFVLASAGYDGFNKELQNVDINSLYTEFQNVFKGTLLSINGFENLINRMKTVVPAINKTMNTSSNDVNNVIDTMQAYLRQSDNIPTMFMKELGYQGVDTRGTSFDGFKHGSVVYDLDRSSPYIKSFDTAKELIEYYNQNLTQTNNIQDTSLQEIQNILNQIYGVLQGFTGIKAKDQDSVEVQKPVDESRLNQDKFSEQDLSVLGSILNAVNGINSYLTSNKYNPTSEGIDTDNNAVSNIYTLLSSRLSQNLASERTLSEAVSLINLLLDKSKLEKDLTTKATQYNDPQSFRDNNKTALKALGIDTRSMLEFWRKANYSREDFQPIETTIEDAVDIIRSKVPENILDGWFVKSESPYKPALESIALADKDVRNAALNVMWDNYKQFSGKDIDFNKFLYSNIPVYRGKNQENYTNDDKVLSFTFDRSVAERFGKHILETVIRPIDTIGSYQTTAEGEVMVRKDYLDALPEFQTWLNNMSSGLKESFVQATSADSDVGGNSDYALETTLQSVKSVLESILNRMDVSEEQQIKPDAAVSEGSDNIIPDEQDGSGYALETTLQSVVTILNNILTGISISDELSAFTQPLSDAVAALKNVADGIVQHQKAQKSDTRVAQARIEDPAQQDVIRQKAIDTGLKLGSDVQIATLDSLTNGLVRVSGAFKNVDGEWEGFTVKVNEANEAVDLAINKQSAFAKSLNKTSEQMADDSNPYVYSKDEVEARAQKHIDEYAAQGKNATVQFKDSGRYTITILEEIDGLSKQIFQTFDENDDKIERTTVTMSNSQKMKLDALQKKLIDNGLSSGLISDKDQIYVDYQKASDELNNMTDAYSKLDDISDDQITKWKQQITLVQQLGSQVTDLINQKKLESDKKIFESDRSKKLSKFDLDRTKLYKDISVPDSFKGQIDDSRKAIETAADSDALKVAINNWEALKNKINETAVQQDLYIKKVKDVQDPFSQDLSAQGISFDKYKKSIENTLGVTDELKTKIQTLETELKSVNDSASLSEWQKKFADLQNEIGNAQWGAKRDKTEQSKRVRGELNSKLKEAGLNRQIENPNVDQQEILDKRDELLKQLDEYNMKIGSGQRAEISGIEQTKTALFGLIDAYKQKNNIVNANGNPSKQAYGTAQLLNQGAKYNSLVSRAQSADLTGDFDAVKKLTDAYDKLKEAQSKFKIGEDLTTESGKAKVEAFKQAQIEFNRYAQELGKVVKQEEKLKQDQVDSSPVAEDFQNEWQSRKKALEDFVSKIPDAAIGEFDKKFTKLTYTVKNGDGTLTNMTATLNAAGTAIYATAGKTEKATTAFGRFFDELHNKAKGIATYLISMTGFQEIWQQIRKGVQYIIEIDTALTELKKVTNETDATYDQFLQNMSKTAATVGSTVSELTTMAAEWARLGYSIEEAGKLAESTAILLNVSEFDNATEASKALISTMQAFSYTADESQHVVDILNEVGNNYAVSSDGLATALQDSASALMEGGNNLEQSVALIAAANKVVQDTNSVGSALRTISLRLRGTSVDVLKEMGEETDGVITSVSKLQSKIQGLSGVNILTESGDYKDTYTILKEIGQVWEDMSDIDQAALLELMAGKNRANTLSAILGNMSDLTSAYETAMNAEGSAARENATYMDSIQGRIDQFNNAVQTMWMNFIDSDVIKFIVNIGTALANLIDKVGVLQTALTVLFSYKSIFSKNKIDFASILGIHDKKNGFVFGKQGLSKSIVNLVGNIKNKLSGIKIGDNIGGDIVNNILNTDDIAVSAEEFASAIKDNIENYATINTSEIDSEIDDIQNKLATAREQLNNAKAADWDYYKSMGSVTPAEDRDARIQEKTQEVKELETQLTNLQEQRNSMMSSVANDTAGSILEQVDEEREGYESIFSVLSEIKDVKLSIGDEQDAAKKIDEITEAAKNGQSALANYMQGLDDSDVALKAYVASVDDGNYSLTGFQQFIQQHNAGLQQSTFNAYASAAAHAALNAALSMGLSLLISFVVSGISKLINAEKEAAKAAKEATKDAEKLSEEFSSLDDYKKQIKELRKSLDSNNLSQSEAYDARQKLLTIQDELISKFGIEKEGINLVTGAIEDQIDAIDELEKKDAQDWVYSNQKAINDAVKYFDDEDKFGRGFLDFGVAFRNWGVTKDVYNKVAKYINSREHMSQRGRSKGEHDIYFEGSAEEVKSEVEAFEEWLDAYEDELRNELKVESSESRREKLEKDISQLEDYREDLSTFKNDNFGEGSTYATNKALIAEAQEKTAIAKYTDQYMEILQIQDDFLEAQTKGDKNGMRDALDAYHAATAAAKEDATESYMDEFFDGLDGKFATEEFELNLTADDSELKKSIQSVINDSGLSKLDNNQIKDMVSRGLNVEGAIDESGAYTDDQIQGLIELQSEADNAGISIETLISILTNFGLINGKPAEAMADNIRSVGKAYSVLSSEAEKYKDINEILGESVYDGVELSKDQYEALSELIGSEEEFIDCIDTSDGYIVKNVELTKKLIDGKKEELATETKLAKSQAQLQYSDVIQSISDQIASTNVLENVNQELVDSLFDQADALRTIINQYQSLEDSLLGATNAFTEFTNAQDMDAQNTYGSTMVEMVQTMYDAIYKTGEVGTAQFWAAVKAAVPDDIYAGLIPGDKQISAIKNYLEDNLFADLTLDGDSFSIDFDSIENFVKKAQSKGLFSGSGIESFGLSSEFMLSLEDGEDALKKFADQMGVTEAYVYAVFSEMDKYNANGAGLSMLFQLDNSATSQLTILNTQLEQALKTRKELMAQGADLTANTADIRFIQSQQAGVKKQITSDTTKYLDIVDALNDPTKTVGEALSEELIIEIGLQDKEEQTVENVFQEISDYLLQFEEPTTFDLEISKENVEEELEDLKKKIGQEEVDAGVTIDTDGTMKVKDGVNNEDLERYVSLYNTNQFIDDALKSGFTTTETLLSEINENVATIAGDEPKSEETPSNDSGSSENAHGGEGGNFGGAKREGGNKVPTDKPVELPVVFDIPKALAEAYKEYKEDIAKFAELGFYPNQTKFGNIDTNNRQVLEWNDNNLNKYKNELMSWYDDLSWDEIVKDFSGTLSTVMGASSEFFPVEIAFSPILQTENGPVLLDENTVSEYMYGIIDKAGTQFSEGWTGEDLLRLDVEGLEIDGQRIKGLIADVGDTAIQTGEAMHYAGTDGAIAQNFKFIEDSAKEANMSVEDMMFNLEKNANKGTMIFPQEIEKTIDSYMGYISEIKKGIADETWGQGIRMPPEQGAYFNDLASKWKTLKELKESLANGEDPNKILADLYGTIVLETEVDEDSAKKTGEAAGAAVQAGVNSTWSFSNPESYKLTSVESYSQLQSDVVSFNDMLSQTEEIIGENTKVSQEYHDALVEMADSKEDVIACFGDETSLVVKDTKALDRLVKLAKKNTTQNIKLAKSQARLDYYALYKEMRELTNGTKVTNTATLDYINSLYDQMSALEKTIAKYSLLETQLLGAANAYEKFADAQTADSETDYIGSAEDMMLALGQAFNTAELGSETAQAAIAGLVPESVYKDLDTVDEKMAAIYSYFKEGNLSKYFSLEFDDNGNITSAEMKLENLQTFIEDGLGTVFEGDDWQHFELSEDFIKSIEGSKDPLKDFADQMGVTKEVAFAFLETLSDHDIEWLDGDYTSLLEQLLPKTLEGDIYKNVAALADLERQLANGEISAEEYAEKYAELTDTLNENGQAAVDNATQWVEASKEVDTAKSNVERLTKELNELKENGGSEVEIKVKTEELEAASTKLSEALQKKYGLEEPTEMTIQIALDTIDQQMEQWKADNAELTVDVVPKLKQDKDGQWTIPANVEATLNDTEKAAIQNYLDLLNDQYTITVLADENPNDSTEELNNVKTAAEAAQTAIENIPDPNINTTSAKQAIQGLIDKIAEVKSKSVFVTTFTRTIALNADGTAHSGGTANVRGSAHASGNWGLSHSEHDSLVGELGRETIVDPATGKYYTVGDNGAELVDLPKGAIIFNHKQTEDLFKHGHISSRGKMHANGTAYEEGNAHVTIWTGGASNSQPSSSGNSKSSNNKSSNSDKVDKDIFDWFEVLLEEINEQLDLMNAKLENAVGISAKNSLLDQIINVNKNKLSTLKKGLDLYTDYSNKLLKEIPEKYRKMTQDGAVAIGEFAGDADQKTLEAINNYRDWAQKVADLVQQMEELNTEISTLAKQKIDNIAEGYDNKKSIRDSKIDQYEAYNSLLETDVGFESEKIYQAMMSENKSNINILQKQRDAMLAELNKQVEAGNIKKYSQDWYDVVNDISAVDTEIIELKTDIEDYQDSINELHWDKFDLLIDKLNAVSDEADNLIDVLSSKDLVNKDTAEWTDEGITTLGLYAQKMDAAEVQAKKYEEQINYLNKNWKKLGYTEEEYIDKLDELKSGQYDAIKAYNESKDAIVDLNKTRVEAIKDGIQKEIDAYKELIDKKKEELDSEKDLYDFQKSVNEKQKDIAKIQRQLAALAGDNSASARAKRAQLEAELLDAQADLEETYYDRSVSKQQEALDKELENFEDAKNDEMDGWDEYLENTNQVVADSLDVVKANTDAIYQELQAMGKEYGLSITESLTSPWKEGENAIQVFSEKFGLAMSATVDELKKLELEFMETMEKIEKSGSTSVDTVKNNATGYQSAEYKPPKQEESSGGGSSSGSSSGNSGGGDSGGKSYPYGKASETSGNIKEGARGNQVKAIQYALNQLGYGNSGTKSVDGKFGSGTKSAVRAFQKAMGISADGIVGKNTRAKFRAKGYKFGTTGVDTDQFAWIDEMGLEEIVLHAQDGKLAYLTKGSAVLPHSISENLMKLGQLDPQYMLDINRPQASVSPSIINNTMELSVDNSIGTLISIENFDGNNPDEITKVVNKALEQHTKNLNNALRKFAR
jgi:TP901 family phage tail tape measure protein